MKNEEVKGMAKTEKEIMAELEAESEKLRAEAEAPKVAVEPVAAALEEAAKEVYVSMPEVGLVAAAGSGTASYALVDYSFTSSYRVLWAYAGNAWRRRAINDAQVAGIAKVVMEAARLDVWWTDSKLTFVRCWKKF